MCVCMEIYICMYEYIAYIYIYLYSCNFCPCSRMHCSVVGIIEDKAIRELQVMAVLIRRHVASGGGLTHKQHFRA